MSDFLAELGPLALTLRLKRLADRLLEDGRRLYETIDLPLEPSWYALLLLLRDRGALAVTQAAAHLGLSHPSVVESSRRLEKAGLIVGSPDPTDGRRRMLRLSARAEEEMPEFEKFWGAFRLELTELLASARGDLLGSLTSLETQLAEQGLDRRVARRLAEPLPVSSKRRGERAPAIEIRPVEVADRADVLHIARGLVRSADTYAYDPGTEDDELWSYWAPEGRGRGYVAISEGRVAGAFVIRPNHPGPGAHVANASYAVRADVRGLGLGRRMGEASLALAAEHGFRALQFNIVVSTNEHALRLWRSLGFRIVGTIPEGFRLPDGRLVDHHIMYQGLS